MAGRRVFDRFPNSQGVPGTTVDGTTPDRGSALRVPRPTVASDELPGRLRFVHRHPVRRAPATRRCSVRASAEPQHFSAGTRFPPAATEIQGNLANLHVSTSPSRWRSSQMPTPTSRCGKVAELTYLVVAVLTGYLAMVLLPMAAWQAWRDRSSRFARLRAAILAVGAAVGVLVTLSYGRSANLGDPVSSIVAFGWLVIRKISGSLVLGETNVSLLWPTRSFSPWFLLSLLLLVLVAVLVWRDRRGPSPLWLLTGLFWGALGC